MKRIILALMILLVSISISSADIALTSEARGGNAVRIASFNVMPIQKQINMIVQYGDVDLTIDNWATATEYTAGQLIRHKDGTTYRDKIYTCLETHTSDNFSSDLTADKWEYLEESFTPISSSIYMLTFTDEDYDSVMEGYTFGCIVVLGRIEQKLIDKKEVSGTIIQ